MAISNCLFSPTSENPRGFSVWCLLAKFSANPRKRVIAETVGKHLIHSGGNVQSFPPE